MQQEASSNGIAVVSVAGTLDASTVGSFRQAVAETISSEDLVIDLSRLVFIDSSGLGALVGVIRRVRESGGQAAVACSSPVVTRVLCSAGLDRIVTVSESLDEATAALASAGG
ncbi:MAG TPA: STAS domain-containing protein [Acidimicrobiales bacterium]